jgi:hypothetical protein
MMQQSSFLLPQLLAFLEQPLDWQRAAGQIRCAGIMLVAILRRVPLIRTVLEDVRSLNANTKE